MDVCDYIYLHVRTYMCMSHNHAGMYVGMRVYIYLGSCMNTSQRRHTSATHTYMYISSQLVNLRWSWLICGGASVML